MPPTVSQRTHPDQLAGRPTLPATVACYDCGAEQSPYLAECGDCEAPFQLMCGCETVRRIYERKCTGCGKHFQMPHPKWRHPTEHKSRAFLWAVLITTGVLGLLWLV